MALIRALVRYPDEPLSSIAAKLPKGAAERILRTAQPEADTETRAAALAAPEIFAADNAGSRPREELVTACTEFLATHAASPGAADVAFKLGELHSRAGDHAAAESVLANLARSLPDPEAAALAKFLAAQAAARSMSTEGAEQGLPWSKFLAVTMVCAAASRSALAST